MRAPWCRWLAAVGVALALLVAPPQPEAAIGQVPVPTGAPDGMAPSLRPPVDGDAADGALPAALDRQPRADDVAREYSLFGNQNRNWLTTLALGTSVRVSGAEPIEMLRFPGNSITQDGTRCEGGELLVVRTLALLNLGWMEGHALGDLILRFNGSAAERNSL